MRVQRSFLRIFPVAIFARGKSVRLQEQSTTEAISTYARSAMRNGEVIGYALPGQHGFEHDDEHAAVLLIPLDASSLAYPRAINAVPVRLVRIPEFGPSLRELAGESRPTYRRTRTAVLN